MTMLMDSVESIDRQIRQLSKQEGIEEEQKTIIKSMLDYYLKSMTYEDAKKLIIEILKINEEKFNKATKE